MRSTLVFMRPAAVLSVLSLAILGGCSTPPLEEREMASELATEAAPDAPEAVEGEVKVVQTSAQAKKYMTEEQVRQARRECLRKARRITGSRIPRNACQGSGSMYGQAPHIQGAEEGAAAGALPGQ